MDNTEYKKYIEGLLNKNNEILLIVPPFSLLEMPCIGLDILFTIASQENIKTDVFYANIAFAKYIGIKKYVYISKCLMSLYDLIGERIFSKAAYPEKKILGDNFDIIKSDLFNNINENFLKKKDVREIAEESIEWSDLIADEILKTNYKIIGVTTGHQQTNSAIAIINRIKNIDHSRIITMGGSACDGEMAEGIQSLSKNIDYVFRGESELSWRYFLRKYKKNQLPKRGIIEPVKLDNLDIIETSTYNYYYEQLKYIDLRIDSISILYEGSRGCWWGDHRKCNFCGVNGWNKNYRCKSEKKIVSDIEKILKEHPDAKIQMVDTLMPRKYLSTLLPILKNKFPKLNLFYEQRADLTLEQLIKLKRFGVNYTQVGIEALTTPILKKINKGIDAKTNIEFLRYAKSVGCFIGWNFLYAIPNDTNKDWNEIFNLLPHIYHLNPPFGIRKLEIARFSPYFCNPNLFNIYDIYPESIYSEIFPSFADLKNLAWLFKCSFKSYSNENKQFLNKLFYFLKLWMNKWNTEKSKIPQLKVLLKDSEYYVFDSRDNDKLEKISKQGARILLYGFNENTSKEDILWSLKNKYIIDYENHYIPLATAHPKLYKELKNA